MTLNPRWLAWEQACPEHAGKTYEFLIWMSQRWVAFHAEVQHPGRRTAAGPPCLACMAAATDGAFDAWLRAQYPEAYAQA